MTTLNIILSLISIALIPFAFIIIVREAKKNGYSNLTIFLLLLCILAYGIFKAL